MIKHVCKGRHGKGIYYICVCDYCGNEFERMKSAINRKTHQFCSKKCYGEWKAKNCKPWNKGKKGIYSQAQLNSIGESAKRRFTGKKQSIEHIAKRVASFKGYKHSEQTKIKISKLHHSIKGDKNPNYGKFGKFASGWKGGKVKTTEGYIYVYNPSHPFCGKKGYVLQHRLVMEKHLGRYLKKQEVVHHHNGIVDDNRIENLRLFKNGNEHKKYHWLLEHKTPTAVTAGAEQNLNKVLQN